MVPLVLSLAIMESFLEVLLTLTQRALILPLAFVLEGLYRSIMEKMLLYTRHRIQFVEPVADHLLVLSPVLTECMVVTLHLLLLLALIQVVVSLEILTLLDYVVKSTMYMAMLSKFIT